jgi:hypothetical protein
MVPVLVGDMQRCGCLSWKRLVEGGEQKHVVEGCGSRNFDTAWCKEV